MYKTTITALVAVALIAMAAPGTAEHRQDSGEYIAGNGLLVVSDDVEGTGLPGMGIGGAFDLTNPSAPDLPEVTVVDDVHGELEEEALPEAGTAAPLSYVLQCDEEDDNAHCSVFVGPGATMGTITIA